MKGHTLELIITFFCRSPLWMLLRLYIIYFYHEKWLYQVSAPGIKYWKTSWHAEVYFYYNIRYITYNTFILFRQFTLLLLYFLAAHTTLGISVVPIQFELIQCGAILRMIIDAQQQIVLTDIFLYLLQGGETGVAYSHCPDESCILKFQQCLIGAQ